MPLQTERDRVAHLLRRFGLGASESEMEFYSKGGVKGAIDKLLNFGQVEEPFVYDIKNLYVDNPKAKGKVKTLKPRATQMWWYTRLLTTQHPLEQKMTVFWHNHFATSAAKVESGEAMYQHIETLRTNAFLAVSHDPAMLYWLDNGDNLKGKPNENFAREVMELFTLGVGNYSEKDVQEAARAFTGWRYGVRRPNGRVIPSDKIPRQHPEFMFMPQLHDDGAKTLLGSTGAFNGEDVCGLLVGKPECAKFLTRKIWEWFVYADPAPSIIDPLAERWHKSGMVIKTLLRDIMESPEFYSERSYRRLVKNPIDFAVAPARQLGIGQIVEEKIKADLVTMDAMDQAPSVIGVDGKPKPKPGPNRNLGPASAILLSTKAMGMELIYPPDVSGWKPGGNWISTATIIERIKWADMLLAGGLVPVSPNGKRSVRTNAYPSAGLFDGLTDPADAAKKIISVFDAELPEVKVAQLAKAARAAADGGSVTPQNANQIADAVARLVFGSPEFQFC